MADKKVTPRLQEKYTKEILPAMKEQFGRKNEHSLPRLEKIVVNMGAVSYTHLTLPTIYSV